MGGAGNWTKQVLRKGRSDLTWGTEKGEKVTSEHVSELEYYLNTYPTQVEKVHLILWTPFEYNKNWLKY